MSESRLKYGVRRTEHVHTQTEHREGTWRALLVRGRQVPLGPAGTTAVSIAVRRAEYHSGAKGGRAARRERRFRRGSFMSGAQLEDHEGCQL